ncbi:hypothetical protein MTYP_02726 [Methylophilaceae bacterium]|nr:hypothetical protein MTYP_02726 [Methylophilaceae bacterium]
MTRINAATFSAFLFTVVAVYLLGFYPFIPPWAVFISWACFFHMDGGVDRNQAFFSTSMHIGLGAFAAWVSALLLLLNPFGDALGSSLWGPLLIGLVIAMLLRLSVFTRFSVTPALIYGYASIFAFLSAPGGFRLEALLSLSFQNAIIAIGCSVVLGVSAGYLNSILVELLSASSKRTLELPD